MTASPTTAADVVIRYRELRAQHQRHYDALANRGGNALKALGLVGALILAQTWRSLHGIGTPWILLAGFLAVVALVWYSLRQQARLARALRLIVLYDRNLARADPSASTGTEPIKPSTEELVQQPRPTHHLYERDLDILGPNSLFTLLSTVRTGPGERGLAHLLLEPATHDESIQRQASVQELLPQTHLREQIALLGASRFQQLSASFFDGWLDEIPPTFHPALRPALIVTSILNVALLIAGLVHLKPWGDLFPNLALTLGIQAALALALRQKVMPLLNGSARLQQHVRLIADGLALMQSATFATPRLKELQRRALEPAGAVKLLKQLEGQLTIVEQRTKEWYYLLSLLLAAGTQAAISIAAWKRRNAAPMRQWLAAWAEFEALNALATYAFEHPAGDGQYTWPELLPPTHAPLFEATALRHPLLRQAIPNDIALGPAASSFYLISGSNMAGKSTLLRTLGVNAVLAYAGAPVRARSMRLTPLRIGASLALTDSLAEGKSKFLAEVERIGAILAAATGAPVLFLIDEIFSGTNSLDRRAASDAVLRTLIARGAIGALSTHDLALTAIAEDAPLHGLNLHMASPDPADPLAFDYLLKPGINTASSAQAILRLLAIEI